MSTNVCANCGTANSPQARFCAKCGKPLAAQPIAASAVSNCPRCGVPLRQGARFCPGCGFNMSQPLPSAGPAVGAPPQAGGPAPQQAPPPAPGAPPGTVLLRQDMTKAAPTLLIRWMGGAQEQHTLDKPVVRIGRASDNDIVINHMAVSGHHLSLSVSPSGVTVTDLNSTNGTMVNGHQIPPNSPQPVRQGDVIRIGDLTGNSVSLVLQGEEGELLRTLSLGKLDLSQLTSVIIGRDPNAYLPLNHPTVSFRHAMIFKQNGGLIIRDLNSTNGTFVNGTKITQAPLSSGDVIQIGPFKLVYDAQQQMLQQSIGLGHRLDAIRLGREVGKKKMILDDVSLTIQPGEFIALVGGSGAGKTTLLKAMNGYEPANHGHVLLNGEPLYSKLDLYRTQMGYVPQDDIIHRALPVKLALWYAAKLRLPDARPAEINARIMEALKAVDMVEHMDKPVAKLSGGQRKRVSIAVELLARPTLFFLDEPTSGLDPGLEKKMMYDLSRLADEGRTVVLVTHATANIEQCDQVAFMAYGRLAYYGPPNDALKFYNVRDFSDIYIKLSQEYNPAKGKPVPPELQPYYPKYQAAGKVMAGVLWSDHYRQSQYYKKYVADRQKNLGSVSAAGGRAGVQIRRSRDSFIRQTLILARRQFDLIRMDIRTLIILVLLMPLIGLLFASVSGKNYFTGMPGTPEKIKRDLMLSLEGKPVNSEAKNMPTGDAQMLITMLGLAITQGGTFAAAYEIVKERAIYRRERAINLSAVAYVLSKVIILAAFAIFQVASVLLIVGAVVDLNVPGAFFLNNGPLELYVTLYLATIASIMFGLFLSAIVPSSDVVLYAILGQLFLQIVLSGVFFPLGPLNPKKDPVLTYTVPAYWTMNAMGSTIDLQQLNKESFLCKVEEKEEEFPSMTGGEPTKVKIIGAGCEPAIPDLSLYFEHSGGHMIKMWMGLIFHSILWLTLTIIIQARKKTE